MKKRGGEIKKNTPKVNSTFSRIHFSPLFPPFFCFSVRPSHRFSSSREVVKRRKKKKKIEWRRSSIPFFNFSQIAVKFVCQDRGYFFNFPFLKLYDFLFLKLVCLTRRYLVSMFFFFSIQDELKTWEKKFRIKKCRKLDIASNYSSL